MRQECRDAASAALGRPLTDGEMALIAGQLRRAMTVAARSDTAVWRQLSPAARVLAAADRAADALRQGAMAAKAPAFEPRLDAFWDDRLSPSENKAVEMARNGLNTSEIAEEMDSTPGSVAVLLTKARKKGVDVQRLQPGPTDRAGTVKAEIMRLSEPRSDGSKLSAKQIADRIANMGLETTPGSVRTSLSQLKKAGYKPGDPAETQRYLDDGDRMGRRGDLMASRAPTVRIERSGERLTFISSMGRIFARAQPRNRVFRIDSSGVSPEARGTGAGMALYEAAYAEAKRMGRILVSDASVSDDARNIYAALARRGYRVLRGERLDRFGDSRMNKQGGPVYAVLPPGDTRTWPDVMGDYYGIRPEETGAAPSDAIEVPPMPRAEYEALTAAERDLMFSQPRSPGRTGATVADIEAAARRAFGKDTERLMDAGRVVVLDGPEQLPMGVRARLGREIDTLSGLYDPGTDRTYLFANNIRVDQVRGLLLHEVGVHAGMETLLGRERLQRVFADLDALVSAGNSQALEARRLALTNALKPEHVPEETLAYLVEKAPQLPLVRRLLAELRMWVYREFGVNFGRTLNADDLQVLATASLRAEARRGDVRVVGGGGDLLASFAGERALTKLSPPSKSMSGVLRMSDEEVRTWFAQNVRVTSFEDDSITLSYPSRAGLQRRNARMTLSPVELTLGDGSKVRAYDAVTLLGRARTERADRALKPPSAAQVSEAYSFIQGMFTTIRGRLLDNPEKAVIVFSGATGAHAKLYRALLSKAQIPGYDVYTRTVSRAYKSSQSQQQPVVTSSTEYLFLVPTEMTARLGSQPTLEYDGFGSTVIKHYETGFEPLNTRSGSSPKSGAPLQRSGSSVGRGDSGDRGGGVSGDRGVNDGAGADQGATPTFDPIAETLREDPGLDLPGIGPAAKAVEISKANESLAEAMGPALDAAAACALKNGIEPAARRGDKAGAAAILIPFGAAATAAFDDDIAHWLNSGQGKEAA